MIFVPLVSERTALLFTIHNTDIHPVERAPSKNHSQLAKKKKKKLISTKLSFLQLEVGSFTIYFCK